MDVDVWGIHRRTANTTEEDLKENAANAEKWDTKLHSARHERRVEARREVEKGI